MDIRFIAVLRKRNSGNLDQLQSREHFWIDQSKSIYLFTIDKFVVLLEINYPTF